MKKFAILDVDRYIDTIIYTESFAQKFKTVEVPNEAEFGDRIINGKLIKKSIKVTITWEEIRRQRNQLLKETDWTQLPDCQLSEKEKEQYKQYRQALRDLSKNFENPNKVVWPKLQDYLCKIPDKQNIFKKLFTKNQSISQD